jgi:HSP90 family molecular chaperone
MARLAMTIHFRLYTIWTKKKYKLSDEESRRLYRSICHDETRSMDHSIVFSQLAV